MKKLAIIAFAAISSLAFATQPAGPEIKITGTSIQTTTSSAFSMLTNKADEEAYAVQNVSSNAGNVDIAGQSRQTTTLTHGAMVSNHAAGKDAYAAQNLASNSGKVSVSQGATSVQMAMIGGWTSNHAQARATAVQNVSSNNGCSACEPGNGKKPGYGHH